MSDTIVYRQMFLIPRSGIVVINPDTGNPIPQEGDLVPLNKYIRRRMADGDLFEPEAPKTSKSKE